MNKKIIGFLVGFFILLFIGFYFALTKLVPGFGKPELPVLSNVPHFAFDNQEGKTITDKDLVGKVYVAEYFFTTCRGICPKLNTNMKKVAEDYAGEPDFRILSYTVDPETDSVARMKHYATRLAPTRNAGGSSPGAKTASTISPGVGICSTIPKTTR